MVFDDQIRSLKYDLLEYDGSWKPLHYFAKRFFSSVSLIAYKDQNKLFVHLQSSNVDLLEDVLKINIHSFASFESYLVDQTHVEIKPQSSNLVYSKKLNELFNLKACLNQVIFEFQISTNSQNFKSISQIHFKFK